MVALFLINKISIFSCKEFECYCFSCQKIQYLGREYITANTALFANNQIVNVLIFVDIKNCQFFALPLKSHNL